MVEIQVPSLIPSEFGLVDTIQTKGNTKSLRFGLGPISGWRTYTAVITGKITGFDVTPFSCPPVDHLLISPTFFTCLLTSQTRWKGFITFFVSFPLKSV